MSGNYAKESGKKPLIILVGVAALVLVVVIGLIIRLNKKPEETDPLSTKGTTAATQGGDETEGSTLPEDETTEPFEDFPEDGSKDLPIEIIDSTGGNTGSGNNNGGNTSGGNTGGDSTGGGNTGNTGGDTTGGDNTGNTGSGGTDLEVDFSELIGKK